MKGLPGTAARASWEMGDSDTVRVKDVVDKK